MCGFVGYAGSPLPDAVLDRASRSIEHRGPDGSGTFFHSNREACVAMAHRRLAILDLSSAADQPMESHCGRGVIAYNGEIYNYRELKGRMPDVRWRSTGDTEVLLERLMLEGVAGLKGCVGIFALAHYRKDTGEVFLARDHLGVKPVYWAIHGGRFCFASEVKAVLALGVPARLREEVVGEFLLRGWVEHPDTAFEGIHALAPGSWLRWRDGRAEGGTFWQLEPPTPSGDASHELEELLGAAVKGQLIADREVGLYVSGGIDSSVIYALTTGASRERHVALTARIAADDIGLEAIEDDGKWADLLLKDHPSDRRETVVLAPELYAEYQKLLWYLDEPMADPAVVPSFLLARRARELGIAVMLSGMGGDEVFGGYQRYALAPVWRPLTAAGALGRHAVSAVALAMRFSGRARAGRLASYLDRIRLSASEPWPLAYAALVGPIAPAEVDAMVPGDWRAPLRAKLDRALDGWGRASWLSQAQRLDMSGFLASHNLVYADKASMAASVEVRVPLVDHRVVEAAFRLPDRERARPGCLKPWLRRLCARLVGPEIAGRPKAGFTMPIRSWMRGELQHETHRRLQGERLAAVLRPEGVRRVLQEHTEGQRDNTWKLWALLTLDLWLERFDTVR